MTKKKFIGDPHLKKYFNTSIDYHKKLNKQDIQIFQLFFKGINIKTISNSLNINPQKIFNIIRIVGFQNQKIYHKKVDSNKNTKNKQIFNDFILGKTIEQLLKKYNTTPNKLFDSLRKTSELYYQYFSLYYKK